MSEAASHIPQTESFLTGVPLPGEVDILLTDVNAREARRMAKLALLAVPDPATMQGRVRESLVDEPDVEPGQIAAHTIVSVGRRLAHETYPLTDQFTNHYHFAHPRDYDAYVNKPVTKNKDAGATLEFDPSRDERQKQHVPDRVQSEVRTNLRNAHLYRAALAATRQRVKAGLPIEETPARLAASAIEDFAFKLRENQRIWRGIRGAGELDIRVEHVGLYASLHPEYLGTQPELMKLVQIENAKATKFWQRVMGVILEVDMDRSTDADRERAANITELIDFLGVYDATKRPRIT
ncbi:hypothetical protein KA047_00485 [Candidatus Saccharibacteria bacterium]|nr:hypothetical protein [Candidatus Saccharibacteria bacterium]